MDPAIGVEGIPRLQIAHDEVRRERAEREATAGSERPCEPVDHAVFVVAATEEPEAALAEAEHRVELGVEAEVPDVLDAELDRQADGRFASEHDEVGRKVHADNIDAAPGERQRVPAGAAAGVEHAHPRFEREHVDEEVDFLVGTERERVLEIRRPEKRRDRVEPAGLVRCLGH